MITSYSKLMVGQYEALLEARANHEKNDDQELGIAILSVLSSMSRDELLDLPVPEFSRMMNRAAFLYAAPRPDTVAKHYRLGEFDLVPVTDVAKMTAAQYIDFQNFAKMGEGHMAERLSCTLVPRGMRYNSDYDISEVHTAIREYLPITAALGLLAFFLRRSRRLTISTLRSSAKILKRRKGATKEMRSKIEEAVIMAETAAALLQNGDGLPMSTPFLK